LIVFALGVALTDDQVREGKLISFNKELLATQTGRKEPAWNWDAILDPLYHPGEIIHPLYPSLSPLQRQFSKRLPGFRSSYSGRILLPHYSRRGVSRESATWLLERSRVDKRRLYGPRRTFHRNLDRRNVTSLDVVHHYIRSGEWAAGRTEMKQAWTPSIILPRTYFCWSGQDIAVAGYLRNFFNDLGDLFDPTHRRNRVQPDWLQSRSRNLQGFFFYDLTSFTSWFHEQVPFLRSLARRFAGVPVYLVGERLSLTVHDLGSLIDGYTDKTTDFAQFVVSGNLIGEDFGGETFTHQCAGFLGIPGNLITCTIAHGLALASLYADPRELQVPGDDVGAAYFGEESLADGMKCASTLGVLQFDKVFRLPQLSLYLKRLVVDLGASISLAPMLIYPLLPYLVNPRDSSRHRSNQFRIPPSDRLHSRAAHVLVAFHRDLWRLRRGDVDDYSAEIIRLLIRRIHDQVGLPYGAIFQGRLYGSDDPESDHLFVNIPVKFSIDDDGWVFQNPDLVFAGRYVTRMTVRDTTGFEIDHFESLSEGQTIIVRNSKSWRFLEDMGLVDIAGIPGEKIELIGKDARDAFLFSSEPVLREVRVLVDLEPSQLVAAGCIRSPDLPSYTESATPALDYNLQSWRYRRYVDLDDPRSAGFYGRSREWVNDGLATTRSSLSPEPDVVLDY